MSNAKSFNKISIADYLAGEEDAKRRHEYIEGIVYAMVGAKLRHNRISTNATIALGSSLSDSSCEAFNSDTKVRIRQPNGTRFYYPDAMVVCDSNPESDTFQDKPVVVVEVISESTRRTDETEKRDGYLSLDSLQVYIRVEQSMPCVNVDRRTEDGFELLQYEGIDNIVPLPEIGIELALNELYRGVNLPAGDTEETKE